MLKKILLLSAVTSFMFWGCGSENTTSPVHDGRASSNQSDPDSLKNNANDKKDSTENLVNALEAGKVAARMKSFLIRPLSNSSRNLT